MSNAVTKNRWGRSSRRFGAARHSRRNHRLRLRRLLLETLEPKRLLTSDVDLSWNDEIVTDPSDIEDANFDLYSPADSQGGGQNGKSVSSHGSVGDMLANDKAKLNIMAKYVQARSANGDPIYDSSGNPLDVKPLVVTYLQEDLGKGERPSTGAFDAYAAVSLDDGATWKQFNISDSADKSSFKLGQGGGWGGGCDDDHTDDDHTDDDHGGSDGGDGNCGIDDMPPTDGSSEGDGTHGGDGGRFCDPASGDYCGEVAKPMVQVKGNYILMAWTSKYAPRRDPMKIQDRADPTDYHLVRGPQRSVDYTDEGIDKGEVPFSAVWVARGMIDNGGVHWLEPEQITSARRDALQVAAAGATGKGFAMVWQEDPRGLRVGHAYGPGDGWSGATVNHKTDIWYSHISWANFWAPGDAPIDPGPNFPQNDGDGIGKQWAQNYLADPVRITDNRGVKVEKLEEGKAPPVYEQICRQEQVTDENGMPVNQWVTSDEGFCISKPEYGGKELHGNTGSSRPQVFMQGNEAIIGYEETKGLGSGPPDDHHEEGDTSVATTSETEPEDVGKYVIYHHFSNFTQPKIISSGNILNLPNEKGEYENARRVRFIVQPKSKAGASGTVLVALYRQGEEGKGAAADIFMRRAENGYAFGNFVHGDVNVSSVSYTQLGDPSPGSPGDTPKVPEWEWSVSNLYDESYDNPYDDSKAHRAQLRGDTLIIGYIWTPNAAAASHGHDNYNFFVRRSFDGGHSLTDVKGNPEAPRNVSNLPNHHSTVFEPRIMATPGSLKSSGEPEDAQSPYVYFVSYGTANNPVSTGNPGLPEPPKYPQDMYYARTIDRGETYEMVDTPSGKKWDWLAKGPSEQSGAQIRLTPAGNSLYATWLQESRGNDGNVAGSDIFFRKIEYPMAFIEGPEQSVRSQPLTYKVWADKPGNYEYDIDWNGDGLVDQTVAGTETGAEVVHTYTDVEENTIRVLARCTDEVLYPSGEMKPIYPQPGFEYHEVKTTVIGVWDGALHIGGTPEGEHILLGRKKSSDEVIIKIGKEDHTGPMQPQVVVYAGDGDDHVSTSEDLVAQFELHGGSGNDHLQAGKGNDILFGEDGDDKLHGYKGSDILVGGDGQDELFGNNDADVLIGGLGSDDAKGDTGNDLVIGGITIYDHDAEMLGDILDRLLSASDAGDLTEYLRVGETVFDDQVTDSLQGGSDDKKLPVKDVFFADIDGADGDDDITKDLKGDEFVFDLEEFLMPPL